jgi:hypothetical protein
MYLLYGEYSRFAPSSDNPANFGAGVGFSIN